MAVTSKAAAEEITSLTSNSYQLAEMTGKRAGENLPRKKKVHLVQDISNASKEQSQAAEQFSQSVRLLNLVAQKNAAWSEELASTSEEMNKQATLLRELISHFKVNSSSARSNTLKHQPSPKNEKKEFIPLFSPEQKIFIKNWLCLSIGMRIYHFGDPFDST